MDLWTKREATFCTTWPLGLYQPPYPLSVDLAWTKVVVLCSANSCVIVQVQGVAGAEWAAGSVCV